MRSHCVIGIALFSAATLLSTGCGHAPEGTGPSDAMTRDATGTPDASLVDSSNASDSAKGEDAPAMDAPSESASDDAKPPPAGLPLAFFSMTTNSQGASHLPTVPFGGLRLWDTGAVWPLLNTASGVYDWSALEAWLAEAASAGVDVIFTFGRTPTWASLRPTEACDYGKGCAAPPSDVESGDTFLKTFTTALVNYSLASSTAHIKYYEIWNEPDVSGTWTGTAAQLATMGQDIATIVHKLDPSALVVGPSPSTGNSSGIHFLPAYYDAGGAPHQDIVGMHAYVYSGSTFATAPEGIVTTMTQLKLLMSANGISNKPIFFTEGSWGGPPTNASMTDDQKVAYLARDYLLMWMNGVERYYWYAWDNSGWGTLFGTAIEPAGTAYGILEGWLVGSTHTAGNCTEDTASTWTCSLTLASKDPALILWNPTSTVTVSVPSTYEHYFTLDDATANAVTSGMVSVGDKPIMVTH